LSPEDADSKHPRGLGEARGRGPNCGGTLPSSLRSYRRLPSAACLFLDQQSYTLQLASSVAVARTRDALYNSWDKNDPKDAQVILHLLKTGATQHFHDPLKSGYHDLLEIANTYEQIPAAKWFSGT